MREKKNNRREGVAKERFWLSEEKVSMLSSTQDYFSSLK